MKQTFLAIFTFVLLGCAAAPVPPQLANQAESILTAAPGDTWTLIEFNNSGESVRTLRLELTNKPADTCISGDWKQVNVVSDPSHYTRSPAYVLTENRLEILLNTGLCDAYDSYIFDKDASLGRGEHVAYGMFGGKTLGRVIAYRTR